MTTSLNSHKGSSNKAREELVCVEFSLVTLRALGVWVTKATELSFEAIHQHVDSHGHLRWHHSKNVDKLVQYLEPKGYSYAEVMEKDKRSLILTLNTHACN